MKSRIVSAVYVGPAGTSAAISKPNSASMQRTVKSLPRSTAGLGCVECDISTPKNGASTARAFWASTLVQAILYPIGRPPVAARIFFTNLGLDLVPLGERPRHDVRGQGGDRGCFVRMSQQAIRAAAVDPVHLVVSCSLCDHHEISRVFPQ